MTTNEKINWTEKDIADLRELREALDTMPVKELAKGYLKNDNHCHCALGALAWKRQYAEQAIKAANTRADLYPDLFHATDCFTNNVWRTNDMEKYAKQSNDARWRRMRAWVEEQITGWEAEHPQPEPVLATHEHKPDPLVEAVKQAQRHGVQ